MSEIESAGDKAFKSDLNRYLDNAEAEERRAESAEKTAQFLMQKGEEFYPWTFEHFEEAMENAPKFERLVVWSCLVKAINTSLNNAQENHFALHVLEEMVDGYWHQLAFQKANKNT